MASLDFERIRRFFDFTAESSGRIHVDDTTAADLHLHKVYQKIDRTLTSPGRAYLYYLLRTQCQNQDEFKHRMSGVKRFSRNSKQNAVLLKLLKKLGFQTSGNAAVDLWQFSAIEQTKYLTLLRFWIALTLACICTPFLLGAHMVIFIVLPIFIINLVIHARTKPAFAPHIPSLIYVFKLLAFAKDATRRPGFKELTEIKELTKLLSRAEPLKRKTPVFQPVMNAGGDLISLLIEYLRIFILLDLHVFLTSYNKIGEHKRELKRIYEIVGCIDAYQSVAAYCNCEEVCGTICSPELRGIEFTDLKHPLLDNCVGNSLEAKRDIILTGTNMSGKSTFLRTFGINQVLATSLGIAFAKRYNTGFFFVVSSISTVDEVLQGKSRYFIEAERLLEILTVSKEHSNDFLFLVDEILSGTNSADRIPASISILRKLGEEELHFDYVIKAGIVHHRNAIKILKFLGYPDDIIK